MPDRKAWTPVWRAPIFFLFDCFIRVLNYGWVSFIERSVHALLFWFVLGNVVLIYSSFPARCTLQLWITLNDIEFFPVYLFHCCSFIFWEFLLFLDFLNWVNVELADVCAIQKLHVKALVFLYEHGLCALFGLESLQEMLKYAVTKSFFELILIALLMGFLQKLPGILNWCVLIFLNRAIDSIFHKGPWSQLVNYKHQFGVHLRLSKILEHEMHKRFRKIKIFFFWAIIQLEK